MKAYALITPAHNEEGTIGQTICSVVAQTLRPVEWIIVNDSSSDRTQVVVERYLPEFPFIKLLNVKRPPGRHFSNKANAFKAGIAELSRDDYAFLGNLDADMTIESCYFETIVGEFVKAPRLGLAGGMVHSKRGDRFVSQNVALDSVAGAVQLFRRECYERIGGYVGLPFGGIDSLAEIKARMHGWEVRTYPECVALEHRQTGTATRGPIAARFQEGMRFRSMGYGTLFFALRCIYRAAEAPFLMGSVAALSGFLKAAFTRIPVAVGSDVRAFLRQEQQTKLRALLPFRGNACGQHRNAGLRHRAELVAGDMKSLRKG